MGCRGGVLDRVRRALGAPRCGIAIAAQRLAAQLTDLGRGAARFSTGDKPAVSEAGRLRFGALVRGGRGRDAASIEAAEYPGASSRCSAPTSERGAMLARSNAGC